MRKPRLQIVRGLPGSGKSTYATTFWPHLLRLEFDFYCHRGGTYAWGPIRNTQGQLWLDKMVKRTCKERFDFVVTGVFAGHSEHLGKTIRYALENGYEVFVMTLNGNFGNRHACREEDLAAMRADFKPERELMVEYKEEPDVHFGSMPSGYTIEPLNE